MRTSVLTALLVTVSCCHCQAAERQLSLCRAGHLSSPTKEPILIAQEYSTEHALAVFYVIPSDITYEESVFQRLVEATRDIQAWYQCATGGLTWKLAFPEAVHVYYAQQTRDYYRTNGDWWGSLLDEMASNGLPIWASGTVTAIWARGAGWWAGAAQGCGVDCGVGLLGIEAFPEFNQPEWSGGECPASVGPDAWPCTPLGAFAHELGHTLGLPHPADAPETSLFASHSIMQTHWDYSNYASAADSPWGFLTLERQKIRINPFMYGDIDLVQSYPDCDVVNLPPNGPTPVSGFQLGIQGLTISTTNASEGATLYYWTFGDGTVSGESNPTHTYAQPDTYNLTLRTSADNSMMDLFTRSVTLNGAIAFFPASLAFGQSFAGSTSVAQGVTLINSGTNLLTIGSIAVAGPDPGDFVETNDCPVSPSTLATSAACTVGIAFAPKTTGHKSATVNITDDAAGSPHLVPVAGTAVDFSITAASGSSTTKIVTPGQTAVYSLTVTPSGLSGAARLSCSNVPPAAACAFSPNPVTLDGATPTDANLVVTTGGISRARLQPPSRPSATGSYAGWSLLLTSLVVLVLASRVIPGPRPSAGRVALLALLPFLWVACGGGGSAPRPGAGTPAGTYTLIATATVQSVTRSVTLTLKVN